MGPRYRAGLQSPEPSSAEARVPSPVRERDRVRVENVPEGSHPSSQPSPERERGRVAPSALVKS
ncbi:hypothetical protein CIW48_25065 [Methylobacterium sp. P1-11]|nr:hypothetical protein CIW48_25065 [Methylobacterium sp. P1-11]